MAETIQIDYEALNNIASRFDNNYEISRQMYQALAEQIDQLRAGGWVGEGANAFYAEMDNSLLPTMNRLAESMRNAEYTIKAIQAELQTAEEEAESIVNNNMSDSGEGSGGGSGSGGKSGGGGDGSKAKPTAPPAAAKPNTGGFGDSGRTGASLNQTLDSFNVETNGRYAKFRDGNPNTYDTYCNLFAADVAKKLGAPLPLFVTDGNGNITKWLGATAMQQWLNGELNVPGQYTQGPQNGWSQLGHADAVRAANEGHLVVVAGHGHMAVVRSGGNPAAGLNNVPIAQAGENNFSSGALQNGWGRFSNEAQFFIFRG